MKNIKVRAIADGAVCTALTVLLTVIAIYVPLFSLVSVAVVGIPLMYLGIKHGFKMSVTAMIAAVLVLFILTGEILTAVLFGVINILPGVAMGFSIRKKQPFGTTVIIASGAVLVGLILQLLAIKYVGDGNGIVKMIDGTINTTKDMMFSVIHDLPALGTEQGVDIAGTLNDAFELMRESIYLYMPAFIIGASAIMGYCAFMFAIFVLKRIGFVKIPYIPFKHIYASRGICYGAVFLMLITTFNESNSVFVSAIKNIDALLYAFIFISGFALIDFKFSQKVASGYGRCGIYLIGFVVGYLFIGFIIRILIFVGLFDGMFNFRQIDKVGDNGAKHG